MVEPWVGSWLELDAMQDMRGSTAAARRAMYDDAPWLPPTKQKPRGALPPWPLKAVKPEAPLPKLSWRGGHLE